MVATSRKAAADSRYDEIYRRAERDPEGFWAEAAADIDWMKPWNKVFDKDQGVYGRWFIGAKCNTCFNAVDRHVDKGRGAQAAIIYDSPVSGSKRTISYAGLLEEVRVLASVLRDLGVGKGDRVIIYMPMVPEAAFAMLACARIGAIHSVVFGGFAPRELATRIEDAAPKVILSASCGIEPTRIVAYKPLLDEAIELASVKPKKCLILQRPQAKAAMTEKRDLDWAEAVGEARAAGKSADCVPVAATDPLYILYTSGTTGKPKGVVRDNGGHLVALKWSMPNLYGVAPGEVWWTASDVGWVVGHSYIVYAPLFHGCTSVLYEGKPVGTPDAGAFWRVIAEHGVVALFTAPTAFRAIKKEDPDGKLLKQYELAKFRTLFLAGERADPDTVKWAERMLGVPVIDHWWQTETGWCIAGNPMGLGMLPVKYGSPTVPMPGYDAACAGRGRQAIARQEHGLDRHQVCRCRLPACRRCGTPTSGFARATSRIFPATTIPATRAFVDEDGYVYVMGRTDDIINVAGHRLSTGGMEEVIASHPDVAECAVLGIKDELKGEVPCGFIVLKSGVAKAPPDDRERGGGAGARQDRAGRRLQVGHHGGAPAQDALGKDPARHHEEDRRRRQLHDAGHHRGRRRARRGGGGAKAAPHLTFRC